MLLFAGMSDAPTQSKSLETLPGNGGGSKTRRRNCRNCGKFTPKSKRGAVKLHCNYTCYGLAQRGKSRDDRTSPSKKAYIQIRHEDGSREYWHRYVYRQEFGEIPEGMVVHHKSENKRVNDADNLGLMPVNEHTPNAHYHWKTRKLEDETSGIDKELGF